MTQRLLTFREAAAKLGWVDEGAPDTEEEAAGRRLRWAATAAVVLAVFYGGFFASSPAGGGTLRWIDSEGRGVMVLDDDPETTIIWVLDGATEGASRGGRSDVV